MYLNYTGLSGQRTGCVVFLGITALNSSEDKGKGRNAESDSKRRLMLVFERAGAGNLLGFLYRELRWTSYLEGWFRVVRMMSGIANGLRTMHRNRVIHRYERILAYTQSILIIQRPTPGQRARHRDNDSFRWLYDSERN